MRIVLQRRDRNLYFKETDSWTPDPAEAKDFMSSTTVLDFCALNRIEDCQVVLKFEEERYEIVLPEIIPLPSAEDLPGEAA